MRSQIIELSAWDKLMYQECDIHLSIDPWIRPTLSTFDFNWLLLTLIRFFYQILAFQLPIWYLAVYTLLNRPEWVWMRGLKVKNPISLVWKAQSLHLHRIFKHKKSSALLACPIMQTRYSAPGEFQEKILRLFLTSTYSSHMHPMPVNLSERWRKTGTTFFGGGT